MTLYRIALTMLTHTKLSFVFFDKKGETTGVVAIVVGSSNIGDALFIISHCACILFGFYYYH